MNDRALSDDPDPGDPQGFSGDPDPVQLASLMCSRLCHDLLSPVGAMTNGIELLAEETDPAMRDRCVELLEQGARRSATKLRFFRLAFGAAGGFEDALPAPELKELIEAYAAEMRELEIDWTVFAGGLPKHAARVLLNLALIGMEALPRGGTLAIGAEETGDAYELALCAQGQRVAFDEEIGRALRGDARAGELSARTVPAELTRLTAAAAGGSLQYRLRGDALVLGAVLPHG